jgi:hypothetical protein
MGDGSWVSIGWGWVAGWNESGWPASTHAASSQWCTKTLFVMTRGMSEPSL